MGRTPTAARPKRARLPTAAAVLAALAAVAVSGCTTVDPYEVTCGQINNSPRKLRETSLALAGENVQKKVQYEDEMLGLCLKEPADFKPARRVKPKE